VTQLCRCSWSRFALCAIIEGPPQALRAPRYTKAL